MDKDTRALLKENDNRERTLSPAGRRIMSEIVVYLRVQDISERHQEEIRRDILALAAAAEGQGLTVQDMIGEDIQAYCDEKAAGYPRLGRREKRRSRLSIFFSCAAVVLGIWLLKGAVSAGSAGGPGAESLLYLPLTLGDMIAMVLIFVVSILLVRYVGRTSAGKAGRVKWGKRGGYFWLVMALVLIGVIGAPMKILEPSVTVWTPGALLLFLLFLILGSVLDKK